MAISPKSIKLLWSNAAGLCAFPECRERLAMAATDEGSAYTIGEMAHICGERPGSNRHNPNQSADERDDYANLILLCPNHHTTVDKRENEARFPATTLLSMKASHEEFVQASLSIADLPDRPAVAVAIASLLIENRQAWSSFGPLSETARRNPHSESAYEVWLSERLTTIVPNNRRISAILRAKPDAFTAKERPTIAAFMQHARGYERWVADEISYEDVLRFPASFADLIEEIVSAGP